MTKNLTWKDLLDYTKNMLSYETSGSIQDHTKNNPIPFLNGNDEFGTWATVDYKNDHEATYILAIYVNDRVNDSFKEICVIVFLCDTESGSIYGTLCIPTKEGIYPMSTEYAYSREYSKRLKNIYGEINGARAKWDTFLREPYNKKLRSVIEEMLKSWQEAGGFDIDIVPRATILY